MTLDALGNIGEVVGALGVVVSLIYLSIQLRQNTLSVRSATHQSIIASAATTNALITQDKALARLFRVGCEDAGGLDEDERVQFSFLCSQFLDIFENLFLHHRHGSLDDDFWQPRARAYLDLFLSPGFAHCWNERKIHYALSFQQFVESQLRTLQVESEIGRRLFLGGARRNGEPQSSA